MNNIGDAGSKLTVLTQKNNPTEWQFHASPIVSPKAQPGSPRPIEAVGTDTVVISAAKILERYVLEDYKHHLMQNPLMTKPTPISKAQLQKLIEEKQSELQNPLLKAILKEIEYESSRKLEAQSQNEKMILKMQSLYGENSPLIETLKLLWEDRQKEFDNRIQALEIQKSVSETMPLDPPKKLPQMQALSQLETAMVRLKDDAARTIQKYWRGRKPITQEQRKKLEMEFQQYKVQKAAAKAQENQLLETGEIGYEESLTDGLCINPSTIKLDRIYIAKYSPEYIKSALGSKILVDRKRDAVLNKFLLSSDVQALKNKTPNARATIESELSFLEDSMILVRQQFNRLDYESAVSLFDEFDTKYQTILNPTNLRLRIGSFMEAGVGVCRHLSLLSKIMFDEIGVKTTLDNGYHGSFKDKCDPPSPHAWNRVRLPSGREYLFDAMQGILYSLYDPEWRQDYGEYYHKCGDVPGYKDLFEKAKQVQATQGRLGSPCTPSN